MKTVDDCDELDALVLYEPCFQYINNIGIYGEHDSFIVSSYTESLVLIDQ